MSRSGWLFSATASIGAWAIVTSAGCSLLSGLNQLTGAPGDAAVDNALSSSRTPSDDGASDSPSDDAASENGSRGFGADSATLDSTPEGSGASEGGLEGSTGTDAQSEGGRPKCGSNILPPTMAVASTVTSPNVAAYAVDGLLTTRWESADVDPQSIDVDFGAAVFIGEVDVLWEAACATNYDLEVSMDGATWASIPNGTVTGNTLAANAPSDTPTPPTDWTDAVVTKPLAAVGRYLRVNGTARCTAYSYSIWEIRAYGDHNANCVP